MRYKDETDIPHYLNDLEQVDRIIGRFEMYDEYKDCPKTEFYDKNGVRILPVGALIKKTYQFETRNVAKEFVDLFQIMLPNVTTNPTFTEQAITYDMCIGDVVLCRAIFNNNMATDHGNAIVTVLVNDDGIIKDTSLSYHDKQPIIDLIDLIMEINKEKLTSEVEEN